MWQSQPCAAVPLAEAPVALEPSLQAQGNRERPVAARTDPGDITLSKISAPMPGDEAFATVAIRKARQRRHGNRASAACSPYQGRGAGEDRRAIGAVTKARGGMRSEHPSPGGGRTLLLSAGCLPGQTPRSQADTTFMAASGISMYLSPSSNGTSLSRMADTDRTRKAAWLVGMNGSLPSMML